MKSYLEAARHYITTYRKELLIGLAVVGGAVLCIIIAVAIINMNAAPKVVYKPMNACEAFTKDEAVELMGENVISTEKSPPALVNDVALSRCAYTDGNPDKEQMVVAAIAVRSGVNDKGAEKNKREFIESKKNNATEEVKTNGDDAYFNARAGQLNILNGKTWIIISYGVGSDPLSNSSDKALQLAERVVPPRPVTGTF